MEPIGSHDIYFHVRVIVGLVIGLALTRVLSGIAQIVQHPGKKPLYATHLIWAAIILVSSLHFWWWEFGLIRVQIWRFELFAFVLFYAFLFYLLACLLFPEEMEEYQGYEDYFLSRRRWFFGLLAATYAVDYLDTLIKGRAHLAELGVEYDIRLVVGILLCGVAGWTANRRFHLAFATLWLAYYVSWILRVYDILG